MSYKPAQSVNKNCLNDTISPVFYCAVRSFTSPGQKVKKGIQLNYPKVDTKGKAPILVFLLKSYQGEEAKDNNPLFFKHLAIVFIVLCIVFDENFRDTNV